jgi:RNA polymerase sigma factor (sigma-70 family)
MENASDNNRVLERLKAGDQKLAQELYHELRQPFVSWAVKLYECDQDDAIDVFQQAFTIFYFNVRENKLNNLTSSLRTYIFAIGKNVFREKFRDIKKRQTVSIDDQPVQDLNYDNSIIDKYEAAHNQALVSQLLDKIGEPCKTLLELMYIQGQSTKEVVAAMNYSDERVVRKRKCLCLQKMREILQEMQS